MWDVKYKPNQIFINLIYFFNFQDDWLQEQSKKITKLNQVRSLTLKLDNIKKRNENLQSMKARVAKLKSEKIKSNKGLNYLNHTKKVSNETQRDDIADDEENKDDEHLLLDDEAKNETESDEELIEDAEKDDITKVLRKPYIINV